MTPDVLPILRVTHPTRSLSVPHCVKLVQREGSPAPPAPHVAHLCCGSSKQRQVCTAATPAPPVSWLSTKETALRGHHPSSPGGRPSRSLRRWNCVLRAASCRMPFVGKSNAHTLAPADFIQSHNACSSSTQGGIGHTSRDGAETLSSGAASGEGHSEQGWQPPSQLPGCVCRHRTHRQKLTPAAPCSQGPGRAGEQGAVSCALPGHIWRHSSQAQTLEEMNSG